VPSTAKQTASWRLVLTIASVNAAARPWGTGPCRGLPTFPHALIIERFERKLGEHLRLVFRHFPVTQINPHVQTQPRRQRPPPMGRERRNTRGNFDD
jgi:hypothetical protein